MYVHIIHPKKKAGRNYGIYRTSVIRHSKLVALKLTTSVNQVCPMLIHAVCHFANKVQLQHKPKHDSCLSFIVLRSTFPHFANERPLFYICTFLHYHTYCLGVQMLFFNSTHVTRQINTYVRVNKCFFAIY